jgi:hypothetical protein
MPTLLGYTGSDRPTVKTGVLTSDIAAERLLWSLCCAQQSPLFFRKGTSYKTAQMLLLGDAEQYGEVIKTRCDKARADFVG